MAIGKLIYDSARGRVPAQYTNITKDERENAIRKELFTVMGLDPEAEFNKKAFRRAYRENKTKVFAVIEEIADQVMINGDYQKNSFFNQFVEIKNLSLGDENRFYVEGLNELEVAEFSGSHFNLKRRRVQSGSHFSVEMRDFGVRVYQYFELVMAGREDLSVLVGKIAEGVDKKLAALAQSTFSQAIANLPAEFKMTGTYSQNAALEVLQHVEVSNGVKPILVGTSTALAKLQGKVTMDLSDKMKEEKNAQGYVTLWNGYVCMEVAQGHQIGTFTFNMDNTKVYALCGDDKLVKICLEGDAQVKEINDGTTNADQSMESSLIFKAGASVAYNKMIGYLEIS